MEQIQIGNSELTSSRIGFGTWAIGGWMWDSRDEQQSIATIPSAIDRGISLIDTVHGPPVTRPASVESVPADAEIAR
jgi:aryl-alcohol dehydrogenase-like predicted oxidoreductase